MAFAVCLCGNPDPQLPAQETRGRRVRAHGGLEGPQRHVFPIPAPHSMQKGSGVQEVQERGQAGGEGAVGTQLPKRACRLQAEHTSPTARQPMTAGPQRKLPRESRKARLPGERWLLF